MDEIVRCLKERREELGITPAELAQRSGVSASQIGRIEKGKHSPSLSTVRRLACALQTSLLKLVIDERTPLTRDNTPPHLWDLVDELPGATPEEAAVLLSVLRGEIAKRKLAALEEAERRRGEGPPADNRAAG